VLRRRTFAITAWLFLLGAVGVPVVAFVVIPQFVRQTLVEELPAASGAPSRSGPTETPVTLVSGELVRISLADYGTGTVRIVQVSDGAVLRFDNVDIAGAPDTYVYLSDRIDGTPGRFTDLGRLKATNGSFNYPIPSGVDLRAVRSVVVWCRQFSVTITYAALR
jgi:hypothetical protein